MNEALAKFKGFFLFDVLGDHSNAFAIVEAVTVTIGAAVLIFVQGANSRDFADATVALRPSTVVFPTEVVWLEEEHDGDLSNGQKQQEHLYFLLARV